MWNLEVTVAYVVIAHVKRYYLLSSSQYLYLSVSDWRLPFHLLTNVLAELLNLSIACVSDNLGAHVSTTTSEPPLPPSKTFNAVRCPL